MEYHKTMKRNVLQIYIITMINIKCILRTKRNLFQQAECYMIPFLFFQKNFIKVQLIYNVVFISDIWQNACYIYTYILFSIIIYHKILNIVPCTSISMILWKRQNNRDIKHTNGCQNMGVVAVWSWRDPERLMWYLDCF